MRLSALAAYARTLGCTAEEQVSMIDYTSFKIGGPADVYITAPTEAAAAAALIRCREEDIPVYLLGNGTNLLVGDKGLRGAVIRLDGRQAAPACLLNACASMPGTRRSPAWNSPSASPARWAARYT